MWIVRLALRRTYTFTVMSILILVLGVGAIFTMPTDIFPEVNIPVVSVIWSYTGISPDDMEKRVITIAERAMTTTVAGIEHMESQSYNGFGAIKIYFQPGTRIEEAVAEVTSIQQTILRVLPPNITPPLIIRYSANSVPVIQLAIKSTTQPEEVLYDQALNFIRQPLATVQGASIPLPYGGKPRQIMVDLNLKALYAKGLSPNDVSNALNLQNLILPAGTVKFGTEELLVKLNSSPDVVSAFNDLPIRGQPDGSIVRMRDVAQIHDGYAVQTNIVRQDGERGALLSVLKSGGASTLQIVNRLKARLVQVRAGLAPGLEVQELFDQSVFVKAAVNGVVKEAVIAACLTAIMILVFLGSWRSTLIIATSIPLSILISLLLLDALGYTINIMTLGGLSLAVGILVDDATVELENMHRNLGLPERPSLTHAILNGAQQIATPAFVATLSICIVFVSVVFLTGPAKFLFTPLALAVVFAMMASYFLSRTLVPVMAHFLLGAEVKLYQEESEHEQAAHRQSSDQKLPSAPPPGQNGGKEDGGKNRGADADNTDAKAKTDDGKPAHKDWVWRLHERFNKHFDRFRDRYRGALEWSLDHRPLVIALFVVLFGVSACLTPFIGRDFFPQVDAGQFSLHVRAPAGTRIEVTEEVFQAVENYIRQVVPKEEIKLILDNIGLPVGGVNLAFSSTATIGSTDGDILVALTEKHKPTWDYIRRLRRELPERFPGIDFYFEPADITSQILNFGLPAPIDVQVTGPGRNAKDNHKVTQEIAARVAKLDGAVDVHIHQLLDAPQINVNVDRQRAIQLGLTQSDVANALLISLSSTAQIARNYWVNPQNGVNYAVAVQTKQYDIEDANALNNTPIVVPNQPGAQPQLLLNLASTKRDASPLVISHYNIQPAYDVYADVQDRDLGGLADDIKKIVEEYQPPPPGFFQGLLAKLRPGGGQKKPGGQDQPQPQQSSQSQPSPPPQPQASPSAQAGGEQPPQSPPPPPAGGGGDSNAGSSQGLVGGTQDGKAKLPKGSEIAIRGQVQSMNEAFTKLGIGIVFAVLLVYLLMVVNFQSWLDPLIIITALPGAGSGILWMLFATGTTFSVPSLMGAIMCIGVATSNSILMITFANDQRLAGSDAHAAALEAGYTRLRPVLMTALAMILGMIPMSLGLGEGGEQNAPLGRAVIGGLLVATVTTLVFVPVMYSILRRKDIPVRSVEEVDLLFTEDEPEYQMAHAAADRDQHGGTNGRDDGHRDGGDRRRDPSPQPAGAREGDGDGNGGNGHPRPNRVGEREGGNGQRH